VATFHYSLVGKGSGVSTESAPDIDSGVNYTLQGTVTLQGLGNFTLTGTLTAVGLVHHGHATGTLTLTSTAGTGSITLALTGPQQTFFSPLPKEFHFKLVSATGDYRPLKDKGVIHFHLTTKKPLPVAANGSPVIHGNFTLRINGKSATA
jgi:hypothetical protein